LSDLLGLQYALTFPGFQALVWENVCLSPRISLKQG